MTDILELSAPDLAAMLSSRICHDLINPVGAIGNGLQALDDPAQASMKELAQELITSAAKQSLAKLEFARLAYGASSTAGTQFDTQECKRVAQIYYAIEKANLTWNVEPVMVPKNVGKLLMNMLLIASEAVFRGGEVVVGFSGDVANPTIEIVATSDKEKRQKTLIPANVVEYMSGKVEEVTAREIHPFYTGVLARLAGMDLEIELEDAVFRFSATPKVVA